VIKKLQSIITVKILMSLRLPYRPVTIPLPLHRYRDRPSTTDTIPLPYGYLPLLTVLRYRPLLTVTDYYSLLLTVAFTYRYSPFPTVTSNGE
jgi:hypothetical protein